MIYVRAVRYLFNDDSFYRIVRASDVNCFQWKCHCVVVWKRVDVNCFHQTADKRYDFGCVRRAQHFAKLPTESMRLFSEMHSNRSQNPLKTRFHSILKLNSILIDATFQFDSRLAEHVRPFRAGHMHASATMATSKLNESCQLSNEFEEEEGHTHFFLGPII